MTAATTKPAPGAIVALLESVIGVLFSGVRHRERAAYILCDELVEMACKMRAKEHDRSFNDRCGFYDAWNAPGVQLDAGGLGREVHLRREERNLLQHGSAAATVDDEHCAEALLGATRVIEHCWPGSAGSSYKPWVLTAIRMIELYSSQGDWRIRQSFEDAMRDNVWEEVREGLRENEVAVRPGLRAFWHFAVTNYNDDVEEILDQLT